MRTPFLLWLAATRPAFLSVTVAGVLIGLAVSIHEQRFDSISLGVLTMVFALLAHAGANVLNDYHDAVSGCDAANSDRIAPFTGGSRFIQNGLLSQRQTHHFGYALLAAVIPAGLWLITQSGNGLLWIGLAGLICGWAYSAPPLKLQSRGLGELAITLAWLMVVLGSNYVQGKTLSMSAWMAGLSYALLVANVLFINQIPDRTADQSAGKDTLIVRFGPAIALPGAIVLNALAIVMLLSGIATQSLPVESGMAIVGLIPGLYFQLGLGTHGASPAQLRKTIPATIASCLLFGLLLAASLVI